MLKIEKYVTPSPAQWDIIIEGMRNPMNSWDKSDSGQYWDEYDLEHCFTLGDNDHDLMMRLAKNGPVHAKYRRMIPVWVTITAPLYWWKEMSTYSVGVVTNSCSTMHKIHAKGFTHDDFSWEHLYDSYDENDLGSEELSDYILVALNRYREKFLYTKNKDDWWQMIQLLPSSYNQKRTIMLNYEVLTNIYHSRKNHKLDEWVDFCKWIETLPYSDIITGE